MTIAVYRECKTTTQQQQHQFEPPHSVPTLFANPTVFILATLGVKLAIYY